MATSEENRELTYEQRATWGECPVCQAAPGEWCAPSIGISLGLNVAGEKPNGGVHLARLQAAPKAMRIVPLF